LLHSTFSIIIKRKKTQPPLPSSIAALHKHKQSLPIACIRKKRLPIACQAYCMCDRIQLFNHITNIKKKIINLPITCMAAYENKKTIIYHHNLQK
jgi:hypothetical protein